MDYMLGSITLFAGSYIPKDFALCDGSILEISENTALFSILGTTYGGDGVNNFALPLLGNVTMSNRLGVVAGCKYIICTQGVYPMRD